MNLQRNLLITGGRGFIGVNLLKTITNAWNYKIFDNLGRSSPTGWIGGVENLITGDVRDRELLHSSMRGVSHIVHLAAFGSVMESIQNPVDNFSANAEGTFNVLESAVNSGVKRVIFASTGGALIGDAVPPVDENSLPKPISPYGASKLCGEAYCHAFSVAYGIESICLRFGNVYGPHSAHKKGAVTMFIKALLRDEPIVVYGDGKASRDYVHVDDLCSGISSALEIPLSRPEVFHLASERETTVFELADILRNIAGKPRHEIIFKDSRRGEVSRNFATSRKAREVLGFSPNWKLEDGLAQTWEWFASQGEKILNIETTDS